MKVNSKYHRFIKKVWILENSSSMYKRNTGIMVGDGRFELVFVKGNGYRTIRNCKTETFTKGIYLGGQMNQPLDLEILPDTHITFIKLEPWIISILSKFDFRESLNNTVPFEEINKALFNKLKDLDSVIDLNTILNIISQELSNADGEQTNWRILQNCCSLLDTGYIDFKQAKDTYLKDTRLSARTIENKFTKGIGLSPQQYAIGIRFRKFTEELKNNPKKLTITNLSYKHGFYDQAHLNRLFKKYWGYSPNKIPHQSIFITDEKETFRYYTI